MEWTAVGLRNSISEILIFFLLTAHLSIILDNDQRYAHLLYFTIYSLHSSTCFEHYMLIISRLNCIDAASGIVLSVSASGLRVGREPVLSQPVHRTLVEECNKYIVK